VPAFEAKNGGDFAVSAKFVLSRRSKFPRCQFSFPAATRQGTCSSSYTMFDAPNGWCEECGGFTSAGTSISLFSIYDVWNWQMIFTNEGGAMSRFITGMAILGLMIGTMSACAPDLDGACGDAFRSLESIGRVPGLDTVVSYELRDTLDHCSTVDDWIGSFTENASVVGLKDATEDQAHDYLAAVCVLSAEAEKSSAVCDEAHESGLIQ